MKTHLLAVVMAGVARAATLTYQVTEGSGACSEIRFPKWTRPATQAARDWTVGTWGCNYEVRSAGGTSLFLRLSCNHYPPWRMLEKYAFDLKHPKEIKLIDEATWATGIGFEEKRREIPWPAQFLPTGLQYQGRLFPKSGHHWDGIKTTLMMPDKSRIAVYSYDGTVHRSYTGAPRWDRDRFVVSSYAMSMRPVRQQPPVDDLSFGRGAVSLLQTQYARFEAPPKGSYGPNLVMLIEPTRLNERRPMRRASIRALPTTTFPSSHAYVELLLPERRHRV